MICKKNNYKKILLLPFCLLLMGKACEVDVTDPKVADTVTDLNALFRQGYIEMLDKYGTRHYTMDRDIAFLNMKRVMHELGFEIINSEGNYYMSVTAPAPLPLNDKEWIIVRNEDESEAKLIVSKHLGIKSTFFKLQPDGLNVDGTITFLNTTNGISISITFRTREILPQPEESILPRREYPPPTAAKIGLNKIWKRFEEISLPIANR